MLNDNSPVGGGSRKIDKNHSPKYLFLTLRKFEECRNNTKLPRTVKKTQHVEKKWYIYLEKSNRYSEYVYSILRKIHSLAHEYWNFS